MDKAKMRSKTMQTLTKMGLERIDYNDWAQDDLTDIEAALIAAYHTGWDEGVEAASQVHLKWPSKEVNNAE